ncbi:hypothetical protein AS030_02650 [Fictibacillus enclensis]|uniref:Amine oxidase domain-containing protein n=1 Tax=Fictibacillus enclensis TaxID=1017270 RepID=A0A0V8JBW2_9BACL|nr:FAD/NAD(P)-binding protein [Fictibacillus enclensis]KSU84469.1 hypothetical protein AS030_02650 [Fictibacillus enclensis]
MAKAGIHTVIIEKGKDVGGRAQTVKKKGAYLNLGAHALYKGGEAEAILHELRIKPYGGMPGTKESGIWKQSILPLPHHLSSLFFHKALFLDRHNGIWQSDDETYQINTGSGRHNKPA